MAISPFSTRPASPAGERRRAHLAIAIATAGIAVTLLAYAISPGVRHVVSHAAHSVKHAVGHVLDNDKAEHEHTPAKTPPAKTAKGRRARTAETSRARTPKTSQARTAKTPPAKTVKH